MRKRRRKKLSRMTVLGVLALTAAVCSLLVYRDVQLKAEGKEYKAQLAELQQQKEDLSDEAEELEEFKDYVKTDDYVEEIAREKFGLVYEGEIIFEPEDEE